MAGPETRTIPTTEFIPAIETPQEYVVGIPEAVTSADIPPPGLPPAEATTQPPEDLSLADYVLNQFQPHSQERIHTGYGKHLKLTSGMKEKAKGTFEFFHERFGNSHQFDAEIDTLYQRVNEITDKNDRLALRRYINSLNFRLAHQRRQEQRIAEGMPVVSTPLPVEMVAEVAEPVEEGLSHLPDVEPVSDSPTVIYPVGTEIVIPEEEDEPVQPAVTMEPEPEPEQTPVEAIQNVQATKVQLLPSVQEVPQPSLLQRIGNTFKTIFKPKLKPEIQTKTAGPLIPPSRMNPVLSRRSFLAGVVTEAAAEVTGVGPVSSFIRNINREVATVRTPPAVPPALVAVEHTAAVASAPPDPGTKEELQSSRLPLELENTDQIRAEQRAALEEAMQEREKVRIAEEAEQRRLQQIEQFTLELSALPHVETIKGSIVLQGEKGNFAGNYIPQSETPQLDETTLEVLAELKRTIDAKVAETGGHFSVVLGEGKWQFRYSDKAGTPGETPIEVDVNPAKNIHKMSEELKAQLTTDRRESFTSADEVSLESSGWIYDKDRNIVMIRMQSSYVGNGHQASPAEYGGSFREGGAVYLEVSPQQALELAQKGKYGVSSIGCFDKYDNAKLTNLWVGLYHIGRQGQQMKQKFTYDKKVQEGNTWVTKPMTYDVSVTELLGITDPAILQDQYVDWWARVGNTNIKAKASGICALASILMNTIRRDIRAKGLGDSMVVETKNHSGPDIWYGATGTDQMLFELDDKGEPVMVDSTVFTENGNLPGRTDATVNLQSETAVSVNTGVLHYNPETTTMLMFMNSSLT